ncbi:MAG TPA: zinc-ribbon domain-containing protein [Nitrososphaerales archaeon]|nr:zinc-ribbon domain-containing protein [Nitrososphaerales archaeon]
MSSSGYLKRESLVGKSVVSKNAEIIGTVSDLAVSLDGKVAIQVQRKPAPDGSNSEDMFIGPEEIQAVGDVILLKTTSDMAGKGIASAPAIPQTIPSPVMPPPAPGTSSLGKSCQKCGYVNAPNAKFCIKCGTAL